MKRSIDQPFGDDPMSAWCSHGDLRRRRDVVDTGFGSGADRLK
jgi:hypothetical protein